MSLTGALVAIILLVIFVPVAMSALGDAAKDSQQSAEDRQDARDFGNNPKPGDIVCDIKITVYGQIDLAKRGEIRLPPLFEAGEVYMGPTTTHPEIAVPRWLNCFHNTPEPANLFGVILPLNWFTPLSVLDTNQMGPLDVFVGGESFELRMTGESLTTAKPLTEKSSIKVWERKISIPDSWGTRLPFEWKTEFYLENVKADEYELEFCSIGKSMNNQGAGACVQKTISKPFK